MLDDKTAAAAGGRSRDGARNIPRSFFGFHQMRDASQSPRDVARAAWRFRDRRLPCDGLVMEDMPSVDDLRWGSAVRERLARDLGELRFSTHGLVAEMPFELPSLHETGTEGISRIFDRVVADPLGFSPVALGPRRHSDGATMVRALEESLLMPFLCSRLRAGEIEKELWTFGTEWEARVRQLLDFRMQMQPAMHTLLLEHGTIPLSRVDGDQFAYRLGEDLLLAPVPDSLEEQHRVRLPGGDWYHYWSHRRHSGATAAEVVAQHGHPPLFVRAGAILPSDPVRQHSTEAIPHATFLDVYAADAMHGLLVEENSRGARARTEFRAELSYGILTLVIAPTEGTLRPERMMWSVRVHGLGGGVRAARVDGRAAECGRSARVVEISFRATGERQVLEIEFAEF